MVELTRNGIKKVDKKKQGIGIQLGNEGVGELFTNPIMFERTIIYGALRESKWLMSFRDKVEEEMLEESPRIMPEAGVVNTRKGERRLRRAL